MERDNINDFLSCKFSDDEHEKFRSELENNEELLNEVGDEVIKEYGRIKLKNKLKAIDTEINRSKQMAKTYLIAAIMILALGVPLLINMISGPNGISTERLFAEYFIPYQTVSAVRGNETGDELLSKGVMAYSNGNYEVAIKNLEAVEKKTYIINFYLGISYLGVKPAKGEESIVHLDKVLAVDNDYHQQATWYKAMALIVVDKKRKAKSLLKKIKLNKWFNHDKAIELLKEMS